MEAKTHVSVCEVGSRGKIIASNNSDLGWGGGHCGVTCCQNVSKYDLRDLFGSHSGPFQDLSDDS